MGQMRYVTVPNQGLFAERHSMLAEFHDEVTFFRRQELWVVNDTGSIAQDFERIRIDGRVVFDGLEFAQPRVVAAVARVEWLRCF